MALTERELKQMGEIVEILPRHKAEYEFDRRFEKTRPNQRIAKVVCVRYFKSWSHSWVEIRPEDIAEI